jgi:hypothetical protein
LRKGFDKYVRGIKYRKKLLVEEERCRYYNKTRDERLKKNVFNQWLLFKQNFKKSKAYWYRIFLKVDLTMMRAGFKKWKEGTNIVIQEDLQNI